MSDDGGLPFFGPVAEKGDHSEDETQVEERDPVTEESRDVVREPLRLPQRRLRSKQPPNSVEPEEGMESKSKKGTRQCVRGVVARCISRKSCSIHGEAMAWCEWGEKLLFLEAVSNQWNAWQEKQQQR